MRPVYRLPVIEVPPIFLVSSSFAVAWYPFQTSIARDIIPQGFRRWSRSVRFDYHGIGILIVSFCKLTSSDRIYTTFPPGIHTL